MQILISLLICFTFQTAKPRVNSDIKLHEHLLLDNQLSISIPDSFAQMDEEMLKLKYPSERRPTIVFTNAKGSVNVALIIHHIKFPLSN